MIKSLITPSIDGLIGEMEALVLLLSLTDGTIIETGSIQGCLMIRVAVARPLVRKFQDLRRPKIY